MNPEESNVCEPQQKRSSEKREQFRNTAMQTQFVNTAIQKEMTDLSAHSGEMRTIEQKYAGKKSDVPIEKTGKTDFCISDHVLMYAAYPPPDDHAHLALHLIVAPTGTVRSRINGVTEEGTAMLIASDVMHTSENPNGPLLIFLFDETSADAESLKQRFLQDRDHCILGEELAQQLRNAYHGNLAEYDAKIMEMMGLNGIQSRKMEPRIADVLRILQNAETIDSTTMKTLCEQEHLSQSRLSHLFKEQTGIALNRYLVFARMRKFSDYYLQSGNITDACMRAGFDTPSHFAATCKRMFGISISGVKRSMK